MIGESVVSLNQLLPLTMTEKAKKGTAGGSGNTKKRSYDAFKLVPASTDAEATLPPPDDSVPTTPNTNQQRETTDEFLAPSEVIALLKGGIKDEKIAKRAVLVYESALKHQVAVKKDGTVTFYQPYLAGSSVEYFYTHTYVDVEALTIPNLRVFRC